jgi:hypothetical protein
LLSRSLRLLSRLLQLFAPSLQFLQALLHLILGRLRLLFLRRLLLLPLRNPLHQVVEQHESREDQGIEVRAKIFHPFRPLLSRHG